MHSPASANHKTRVNLYLPSMRPVKEKLPLSLMVVCWGLMSLSMLGLGYYFQSTYEQASAELTQSNTDLKLAKEQLAKLEARHADYKPSPRLMTKLDRLTQELNGKRFLSQHLKGREVPKEQKYSQVMLDLGRLHSESLWVTKMRFEGDKVLLQGFALDALAVPQWLNDLQQSPFFSGKSFALMNLKDADPGNGLIEFEINTTSELMMSEAEKLAAIQAMAKKKAEDQ